MRQDLGDYGHLAREGKLRGQYGCGCFCSIINAQGSFTLPVLDAGNLEGKAVVLIRAH